jgi:hypothetical protein
MASGRKFDHPPLLAPGVHYVTLGQIHRLAVERFDASRDYRKRLFHALEEFVQATLRTGLPGDLAVDGSFLTEKPEPGDVDVIFTVDFDVSEQMSAEQDAFFTSISEDKVVSCVDSLGIIRYPRHHRLFGTTLDVCSMRSHQYGIENSEEWLKGYCVLMVRETNVGRRIRC